MDELKYECIILIRSDLNNKLKRKIHSEIIQLIKKLLGKNKEIIQDTISLAYEINGCTKADALVFEFKIKKKAKYLIKSMQRQINTNKEILAYKVIQKDEIIEKNNYDIYLVYEFDYGDTVNEIKPNVTIFGGYQTRFDAEIKAEELLEEGKENYFIEKELKDIERPFNINNEVHLYSNEKIQKRSVYYIKIEKIKIL